jgi:hypothetical protein
VTVNALSTGSHGANVTCNGTTPCSSCSPGNVWNQALISAF